MTTITAVICVHRATGGSQTAPAWSKSSGVTQRWLRSRCVMRSAEGGKSMSEGIYRPVSEGRSFGFGAVPILVKLEHDETDDAFALVEATFPAGLPGPPRHRHPWHESFYVLSGELKFTVGDDQIFARAGDLVHAPGGVPHTYTNAGSATATALALFSPGRFLAALEEYATAFAPGGTPNMD